MKEHNTLKYSVTDNKNINKGPLLTAVVQTLNTLTPSNDEPVPETFKY